MKLDLSISYLFAAKQPTTGTSYVQSSLGIGFETGKNIIARHVELDVEPGQIVLFVGSSGGGKSSLLREAMRQLVGGGYSAADLDDNLLSTAEDNRSLVDILSENPQQSAALLGQSGLGEAFLMLRSPRELSDGQRYRFAIASCLASGAQIVVADEWCAKLDRITAKVLSLSARKTSAARGTIFLVATTHEDIIGDLQPDWIVRPLGGGKVEVVRKDGPFRKTISFLDQLWISQGTRTDWPYFAGWHYRGHKIGFVHKIFLLWHEAEPIGIAVYTTAALGSSTRNRAFPELAKASPRARARWLNKNVWTQSRLVLDPRYRGAGLASRFNRATCQLCPVRYIESLSEMERQVPLDKAAGFLRIGATKDKSHLTFKDVKGMFHGKKPPTQEWFLKSRHARPIYSIFTNKDIPTC